MFEDNTASVSVDPVAALGAPDQGPHIAARAARATLLDDLDERIRLLPTHPLNQRPVRVLTRAIKQAFLEICGAAAYKHAGVAFCADFRVGKSTAVLMIKDWLRATLPNVAVASLSAQSHKETSERVFYGDMLLAFQLTESGTAQDRKIKLRAAIIAACREAGGTDFVLLIDEGQNWGDTEYTWLRDLANLLRDQDGFCLITAVWGDLRLDQLSSMFRTKRKDLWGRFMLKPQQFQGIRNQEDLRFFLAEHDSIKRCEFPVGSGISFTEYFLPRAYANGWRLANETENLWNAMVQAARGVGQEFSEVGMQWVGEAVIRFLTLRLRDDAADFRTDSKWWGEALALARFADAMV
jgi:hypothetical protein